MRHLLLALVSLLILGQTGPARADCFDFTGDMFSPTETLRGMEQTRSWEVRHQFVGGNAVIEQVWIPRTGYLVVEVGSYAPPVVVAAAPGDTRVATQGAEPYLWNGSYYSVMHISGVLAHQISDGWVDVAAWMEGGASGPILYWLTMIEPKPGWSRDACDPNWVAVQGGGQCERCSGSSSGGGASGGLGTPPPAAQSNPCGCALGSGMCCSLLVMTCIPGQADAAGFCNN